MRCLKRIKEVGENYEPPVHADSEVAAEKILP